VAQHPRGPHRDSRSTADLRRNFRPRVDSFIAALRAAGAQVRVNATLRSPERAYLMHYAWEIARSRADPTRVPPMRGVNIEWVHRNARGGVDLAASRRAAEEMVRAYNMAHPAVLDSRHMYGRAVDISISWSGNLQIRDASGRQVSIRSGSRDGTNPQLRAIGATFGVIKARSDRPHWSDDGL
jgi:hypothetical protein